ncbi:NAD-dependent succinate-semialdehyde dehydrogenase [Dermacoccus nishinomiyaensis]|uniref:NAD-dependent succinate-semialdehyde dehydrogenase n=1 Tax=Dermacoccus nishinomiyaensis TaxID=1274 RepID=UPI0011A6E1E2|nr:NAD-dependent succinate-semialdehyde dehydrogenase [Dermacoccus nishinomiyaensis]MCG7430624.1 NAD-dependent succinate-semialdehyde dehydrogenase [Dermacoccus nishinomiyaensis]
MDTKALINDVPKQLFVDGAWRDAEGGKTLEVTNPATGEVLARVADASPADGDAALAAAHAAQASWAATTPRERSELLRKAFELLIERTDDFAALMTLEMGKPFAEAKGEVAYGAEYFRWFAEEAVRINGSYLPAPAGGSRLLTMKQPVGPCLMITPWNFPLAMGTRKIGPALAAGCTMVIKPAAETPLTMLALVALLEEVGVPKGVVNVVTTSDSGGVMEPLIRDPRARKLTFTGSTAVGRKLVEQSAEQLLRVSMELGGNAPFMVFEDADVDAAVEGAMAAKMRNIGEACTAANRLYVHESVAAEFGEKFAAKMKAMTVGNGMDEGVTVGPLITGKAVKNVQRLIDGAVAAGATKVCGDEQVPSEGNFVAPTVLTNVPGDDDIVREEIFGPVAAIQTFTDEDDVIARANSTEYGLAAYFFSKDYSRALRVAEKLEYGMVGVNVGVISNPAAPFGGVKASGFGREGGFQGIDEYLETKYVGMAL